MALPVLFAIALLSLALPAEAVYRCKHDGKVSYGDVPCAGGTELEILPPAAAREARRRARKEKDALAKIERDQARQATASRKEHARHARRRASEQKRCEKLARHITWSREDAAKATGKAASRAQLRSDRLRARYRAECAQFETRRDALSAIKGH